jgi:hypothetical protein
MTKIFLTAVLGVIGVAPVNEIKYSGNSENSEVLYYSRERKLTWADFGRRQSNGNTAALTVSEISYDFSSFKGKIDINVYCVFHKKHSYVTAKNANDYILNHEQRHFDISYIFAIYCKKRLSLEKNLTSQRASEIYDEIVKKWGEYEELYDAETNNSIDKQKQSIWDGHIDKLLNELE